MKRLKNNKKYTRASTKAEALFADLTDQFSCPSRAVWGSAVT